MRPHPSSFAIFQEGGCQVARVIGGNLGLWVGAPSLAQCVLCGALRKEKDGVRRGPRNGIFELVSFEAVTGQRLVTFSALPLASFFDLDFPNQGLAVQAEGGRAGCRRQPELREGGLRERVAEGWGHVWREKKHSRESKPAPVRLHAQRTNSGTCRVWVG